MDLFHELRGNPWVLVWIWCLRLSCLQPQRKRSICHKELKWSRRIL